MSPGEAACAAGLGLVLGAVAGMPLGVINMAIAEAATAGRQRFAVGLGLGGALADSVHAGAAFAGVARVITARPTWPRALALLSACVIAGYAGVALRRRQRAHAGTQPGSRARGIAMGIALTLPNPGSLAAWVAVAAAVWPSSSPASAVVLAVGVGVGSALWFSWLARWIASAPANSWIVRALPRIALVVLGAIAAFGLWRAWG